MIIAIIGFVALWSGGFWQWAVVIITIMTAYITLIGLFQELKIPENFMGFIIGPLFVLALTYIIARVAKTFSSTINWHDIQKLLFKSIRDFLTIFAIIFIISDFLKLVTGGNFALTNINDDNFPLTVILGFAGIIIGAIEIGLDEDGAKIMSILTVVSLCFYLFIDMLYIGEPFLII